MTSPTRHLRLGLRRIAPVLTLATVAALIPTVANAHAVVLPKKSAPGAFEKYVLRVPNEKDLPTVRVELHFPADMRVVSFEDVPGWQLEIMVDSTKAITSAVWTGTLSPKHFVEFPFEAANPKTATQVAWPTYQTYANGERVEWTGPEHTKTPASVTVIEAVGIDRAGGLAGAALLIAIIKLGADDATTYGHSSRRVSLTGDYRSNQRRASYVRRRLRGLMIFIAVHYTQGRRCQPVGGGCGWWER